MCRQTACIRWVKLGIKNYWGACVSDKLIDLFAEELGVGPASLSDESSPDTVEQWDSLAAMRLVAAIETDFDVRLTTRDIMKMRTIGIARAVLREKGAAV